MDGAANTATLALPFLRVPGGIYQFSTHGNKPAILAAM